MVGHITRLRGALELHEVGVVCGLQSPLKVQPAVDAVWAQAFSWLAQTLGEKWAEHGGVMVHTSERDLGQLNVPERCMHCCGVEVGCLPLCQGG